MHRPFETTCKECSRHLCICGGVVEKRVCGPEEFTCRSTVGECVPLTWMCDDNPDCKDGSDEKACSKMIPLTLNI